MIIFVKAKYIADCIKNYPRDIKVAVSGDINLFGGTFDDGSIFIPPPDIVSRWIDTGDKKRYEEDYLKFLSDPRVFYPLMLRVYMASFDPVFFMFSETDENHKYPKWLKEFIRDTIGVDVGTFKRFKKNVAYDKPTQDRVNRLLADARLKCAEAESVYEK